MLPSLFWHLSAFFAGLISASFISWPAKAAASFSLIFLGLSWRLLPKWRPRLLWLIIFFLGAWRAETIKPADLQLRAYFKQTQVWDFWVCADPEPAWDKQIVILCPLAPSFSPAINSEKVTANLSLYPRVYYGDRLQVRCRLESPPVFADFNYAAYLAAKGIGAVCSWPEIVKHDSGQAGKPIMRKLYNFKRQALVIINQSLPEPSSGLASALLLGYKKTLYPLEELNFQKAGLSHIVAISGGHISLFLNLLISAGIYLGLNKRRAVWPALALAGLYVLLTGVQASAWRSLIMGGIMLYSWRRGRLHSAWAPLLLAAALMLLWNPSLWRQDLGFQLSFLALSGMMVFNPIFTCWNDKYLHSRWRRRHLLPLISAFQLSLSAQLFVWPLLALRSGGLSVIAPLTNAFAFWVFGPLVLSLLAAIGLSSLISGVIIWWPSYLLLSYLLSLAEICASLPGAYIELPGFNLVYAGIYYVSLFTFLLVKFKKNSVDVKNISH